MARTTGQEFTVEEQAAFDEMQAADTVEVIETPAVIEPEEVAAEEQPAQQRTQMVPHAALHEERERRKQSDAALAEERERFRVLGQRTDLLLQNWAPKPASPTETPPAVPDLNTDPVAHIVGTLRNMQQEMEVLRGGAQQRTQQDQVLQTVGQIQQRAQAMEQDFVRENPDYVTAVQHLMDARHRELVRLGYNDPGERQLIIQQEGLGVAARAIQNNQNPAAMIYGLAQERGYQKAKAADPVETPANGNAGANLERVAAGQRQAGSLAGSRGAAPSALTAQTLANMSDADFAEMIKKPEGRALLGS